MVPLRILASTGHEENLRCRRAAKVASWKPARNPETRLCGKKPRWWRQNGALSDIESTRFRTTLATFRESPRGATGPIED